MSIGAILCGSKRWPVFNILLSFCVVYEALGVKIVEFKVPTRVRMDETIELGCYFDLEHEDLYSLSWWKGIHQFYLYGPSGGNQPQQTIYNATGIKVDRLLSGLNKVVLQNVTRNTGGRFKCEVVADQSYKRVFQRKTMEVVEVPNRPPVLTVYRRQFRPGEMLEANCSSPGIEPPSELFWFINGEKISYTHIRLIPTTNRASDWFSQSFYHDPKVVGVRNDVYFPRANEEPPPITSNLKIVLRPNHFIDDGRITLTCIAALPDWYHKSTQVELTLPGVSPVASSHRKSRGSKIRMSANFLWNFLSIAILFLSFPNVDLLPNGPQNYNRWTATNGGQLIYP